VVPRNLEPHRVRVPHLTRETPTPLSSNQTALTRAKAPTKQVERLIRSITLAACAYLDRRKGASLGHVAVKDRRLHHQHAEGTSPAQRAAPH